MLTGDILNPVLPMVGFGTLKLPSNEVYDLLNTALNVGYRLFDTAACNTNEKDIGDAFDRIFTAQDIKRADLFIITKVAPKNLTYDRTIASCMQSISNLKCSYLDCCLLLWPGKAKLRPEDPQHPGFRREAWAALEDLKDQGLIRYIGVSSFTIRHLEELLTYANVKPVVNQVEFHVHLHQKELLQFCNENGIFLQSFSTLGTGVLLSDETVIEVGEKYKRSPAQILLKWALQQGVGVLPKSRNSEHIAENFQLDDFVIDDSDMARLSGLNIDKRYSWNPSVIC